MYKFKLYTFDLVKLENRLKKFSSVDKSFFYDKEWLNACISSCSSKKNFFFVEIYLKEKKTKTLDSIRDKDIDILNRFLIRDFNFNLVEDLLIKLVIIHHQNYLYKVLKNLVDLT